MEDCKLQFNSEYAYGSICQRLPSKVRSLPISKPCEVTRDISISNQLNKKFTKRNSTERQSEKYYESIVGFNPHGNSSISNYFNRFSPSSVTFSSHYRKSPNIQNNSYYRQRTDESLSPLNNRNHEGYYVDTKPYPKLPRVKCTPFRNHSAQQECNGCYSDICVHRPDTDDRTINNNNKRFENNRRSFVKPCQLSCCSTLCYDGKSIYKNSNYGSRGSSPAAYNSHQGVYHQAREQTFKSHERNENNNISPMCSPHVGHIHSSIERDYSNESTPAYKTLQVYEESEQCTTSMCYSMQNHEFPRVNQTYLGKIRDHINTSRNRETFDCNFPNNISHRQWQKFKHCGIPRYEQRESLNDYRDEPINNRREYNIDCGNFTNNLSIKDGYTKRNNIDIENNYKINEKECTRNTNIDKHQKYLNLGNEYQEHVLIKREEEKHLNSENAKWHTEADLTRINRNESLPPNASNCNHKVCNEAAIKAMEAFDNYKRMMLFNSHDKYLQNNNNSNNNNNNNNSNAQHSINQSDVDNHFYNHSHKRTGPCGQLNENKLNRSHDKEHLKYQSPTGNTFIQLHHSKGSPRNPYINKHHIRQSTDILSNQRFPNQPPCVPRKETGSNHENQITNINNVKPEKEIRDHSFPNMDRQNPPLSPPKLLRVTPDSTQNDDSNTHITKNHAVGALHGTTRVQNEHLHPIVGSEKKRSKSNKCLHLWQFLRKTLDEEEDKEDRCIEWTDRELGEFRLINTGALADRWGQSKNSSCMTYEKMARAMRYYYNTNILEKVPHKRLHFRFSAKISSNLLNDSNSKTLLNTSGYQDIYTRTKQITNTPETTSNMFERDNNMVGEYTSGHDVDNQSRNTYTHNITNQTNKVPSPHETTKQDTESDNFPCKTTPKIVANSVVTSPGSIPRVSSTPDMWSDTDSVDDLIIDTDSE